MPIAAPHVQKAPADSCMQQFLGWFNMHNNDLNLVPQCKHYEDMPHGFCAYSTLVLCCLLSQRKMITGCRMWNISINCLLASQLKPSRTIFKQNSRHNIDEAGCLAGQNLPRHIHCTIAEFLASIDYISGKLSASMSCCPQNAFSIQTARSKVRQ